MQNKPTGPAGEVDSLVQKARKHESIDATIASFGGRQPVFVDWGLGLEAAKIVPRIVKARRRWHQPKRQNHTQAAG